MMKTKFVTLLFIAVFCSMFGLFADELPDFSINDSQAAKIKQKLDAYDKGKISIQDLNENATPEECRELVGYYLLHTNAVSTKAKLPIARECLEYGMYSEGSKLSIEYLNVYSNDFRAWKALGAAYMFLKHSDQAVEAYTNAARLGDKDSYLYLADAAIQAGRWDVIKGVIPQLKQLKKSATLPKDNQLDLVGVFVVYSIQTEDDHLFLYALKGISSEQINSRDDLKRFVTIGCEMFPDKETAQIRQEMGLVGTNILNLVTNTPSP